MLFLNGHPTGHAGHFLASQVDFLSLSSFCVFLSIEMSQDCPSKGENSRLAPLTTVKHLHIPDT